MTDAENFYCARCNAQLSCQSCEIEECAKCGTLIVDDASWINEAEYRKRVTKVDRNMDEWNRLNAPLAVRK